MNFEYTKEQLKLKKDVADFAKVEAAKPQREYEEEEGIYQEDLFLSMGKRCWTGPIVPIEYGGMGKGAMEYSIIIEELTKEGLISPQTNVQAEKSILVAGTDEQKKRYLPRLANGEFTSAQAISEPNAGSSFKNLETAAIKDGEYYVIRGHKKHINLAKEAGVFILLTKTESGLTEFLIDKDTEGVKFVKADAMAGRTAPMYDIYIDCRVPKTQILGGEGGALDIFLQTFNLSRIGNASQFIGIGRGCLDLAVKYARERVVGSRHVTDFQGIKWIIAELYANLEAASLARNRAAWMEDNGIEHILETAVAKYLAGEIAEKIATKCFSLVGSHACYHGTMYERFLLGVKAMQVGGGTSEIMLNNIASQALMLEGF